MVFYYAIFLCLCKCYGFFLMLWAWILVLLHASHILNHLHVVYHLRYFYVMCCMCVMTTIIVNVDIGTHDNKLESKTWKFTHQLIIQCKTIERKKGRAKHEGRQCNFCNNPKQLDVQLHWTFQKKQTLSNWVWAFVWKKHNKCCGGWKWWKFW